MATPDPDVLFQRGLEAFNTRDYFDAHEHWEELWSEFQLPDRLFIQSLIQMAVGCFHLTNDNLNGARGLFSKALPKLEPFQPEHRNLDVTAIVAFIRSAVERFQVISRSDEFDMTLVPILGPVK
jgi:predicted metal-dependent hydrolase